MKSIEVRNWPTARRGRIRFRGDDIVRRETHEIARAGIGWVPDDRRVFPTLTVERNLTIARKRSPFPAWPLASLLEVFSPLRYLMRREAGTLSGGEAQMVAIARALVGGPGDDILSGDAGNDFLAGGSGKPNR